MTHPTASPLQALAKYYQRLREDPKQGVAAFGFSVEKISFEVVLEPDGSLFSFGDVRENSDRNRVHPKALLVPFSGGRQGTGLRPFFCWDNTGYALGSDNKGNPQRAAEMFAAFRDLHLLFLPELKNDLGYVALCQFLKTWDPEGCKSLPSWEEAAGLNVVFRLRSAMSFIHQSRVVEAAWLRSLQPASGGSERIRGTSLISGDTEDLARLHPMIKGVAGAQTMGAAIVSFNENAYLSYGKTQSFNAPVGVDDAFRYTTALNRLLADSRRRFRIGDSTVVFWSDGDESADSEELMGQIFGEASASKEPSAEHQITLDRVRHFLSAARSGSLGDVVRQPDAPFYVLGLSPNASRLSVRYWLVGTVSQFAERLARHVGDLDMAGAPPQDPPLIIRRILLETAREPKDIPPQLAGEVARSILSGKTYPQLLFNSVIRRVRADSIVNHRRAAILKAFLIRNRNAEVSVSLKKDHPDQAYQLGRLFAAIESAQSSAMGDLNRSVKDSFFSSAAATPASVFPRLIKVHGYHCAQLPINQDAAHPEKRRTRRFYDQLVQEIFTHIKDFPTHHSLERQGLFYIGYFHQRQDFFTKKSDPTKETNNE